MSWYACYFNYPSIGVSSQRLTSLNAQLLYSKVSQQTTSIVISIVANPSMYALCLILSHLHCIKSITPHLLSPFLILLFSLLILRYHTPTQDISHRMPLHSSSQSSPTSSSSSSPRCLAAARMASISSSASSSSSRSPSPSS